MSEPNVRKRTRVVQIATDKDKMSSRVYLVHFFFGDKELMSGEVIQLERKMLLHGGYEL